ncbi:MAG: pyruvoyl-dependent arginine decarboxylase [archaeon]|nr:pyruvoyl-dependent arginine decarboxylase [archaeon]
MNLVPTKFFVTSSSAVSSISELNAFDRALINAGIGEQNLVSVSSVIPVGAGQIMPIELPMGAVTHCVLAQMRGTEGETISAGIAYGFRKDCKGGYVAEGHLHGSKKSLKADLQWKMNEMARLRGVEFEDISFIIEEQEIPANNYGCCVAALVFTEYRD